jgi:hypothetical protein
MSSRRTGVRISRRAKWAIAATAVVAVCGGVTFGLNREDVQPAAPSGCLAIDGCFPKPPGGGRGAAGIPATTVLAPCGGNTTLEVADAIIDGCEYQGSLIIAADNITIRNSRIHGSVRTQGDESNYRFTLERSEIGPERGCGDYDSLIGVRNFVARGNYVHSNSDAFRVSGDDVVIEDNFVELCDVPGDHSDGVQGLHGGENVLVHHNTIDQSKAKHGPNAAVFFADESRSASVTDNLLISPTFAIKLSDDFTPDAGPWVVTGNRMVGDAATVGTDCSTTTWSDNRAVTVSPDYEVESTGDALDC